MSKIAINGLGRIGRSAFKIILDEPELELTAVNDLIPAENLAYLLNYDTVYRRYKKHVEFQDSHLIVEGKRIKVLSERDPSNLPWKDLDIDVVIESTGRFTKKEDLEKHLKAGAKYVILSAPTKSEEIITVVHGVNNNHEDVQLISCASCTTNCITPIMEIISRRIGIKKAVMTTVHAYTASQAIVDGPNKKMRRGRAAAANFVPASTGAALATTKALPEMKGKFDGVAIRGPVPVGSIADIVISTARATSVREINSIFEEEAETERYKGILGVTHDPIVSSDIIMDSHASIVDLELTQVVDGDLIKIMSWYDNEWGYTNQMIREALKISKNMVHA